MWVWLKVFGGKGRLIIKVDIVYLMLDLRRFYMYLSLNVKYLFVGYWMYMFLCYCFCMDDSYSLK